MYSMFDFKIAFDFRLFEMQELAAYKIEAMNILLAISLFVVFFRSGKVYLNRSNWYCCSNLLCITSAIPFVAET